MTPEIIPFDPTDAMLNWGDLIAAFETGHDLPAGEVRDTLIRRGDDTLLSRCAWITGLGVAVKSATIFPGNSAKTLPSVNGYVSLFDDDTGLLEAVVDFHLVTKWKTAGDSILAASKLARKDAKRVLIVGTGTVAQSLVYAYRSILPKAQFSVWGRTPESANKFAKAHTGLQVATDIETAVRAADIVTCATMATEPLIKGEWLQPGQHIDLIGAYRPDMREVDDAAMAMARIFVDNRKTTLGEIGELIEPVRSGAISPDDVLADFYDLKSGDFCRRSDDEITLFKNGGGAHLDLMTSRYILDTWRTRLGTQETKIRPGPCQSPSQLR